MTDKYHRAARDGLVSTLKEATKRDCNQADEDGLTPTACASYEGKLEALRVLVGRGGDPDKCDYYGNTALHCASAKGHMNCVSFLVNFGANLWSLDNDLHSALDLAAINNRNDIVRYLDIEAAKQEKDDPKRVKKFQEKSKKDSEKRQKEFDKLQRKSDKRRQEEELRLQKDKESLLDPKENKAPKKKSVFDTISKTSLIPKTKNGSQKAIHPNQNSQTPKFSELTTSSSSNHKKTTSGIQKMILKKKISEENKSANDFKVRETERNGVQSVKYLSGLQRDANILIVPNKALTENGKRGKLTDVFDENDSGSLNISTFPKSSIFDRPGFGSVAFRNSMTSALSSFPSNVSESSEAKETSLDSQGSSRGTMETPWEHDEYSSDEEEDSPLYVFLSSNGLGAYVAQFVREQIDFEAMMLLTDQDLENLNMPLGPRRKLLKVLNERRLAVVDHEDEMDVKL